MYYLISNKDSRCYGTADQELTPPEGYTVFQSDTTVNNPHDYVLKDGSLVYDPPKEEEA
ncbi:hypothetical protein [Acidaminococcus fermentans]|uniref:hypothetical protein n=1 Tax=Acidaminococcus fermentans TaxID=905 RepID=UPI00265F3F5E|nr:hypothetical protein [Acidaminococcus fermentans]